MLLAPWFKSATRERAKRADGQRACEKSESRLATVSAVDEAERERVVARQVVTRLRGVDVIPGQESLFEDLGADA
jgi:hypothetical protein